MRFTPALAGGVRQSLPGFGDVAAVACEEHLDRLDRLPLGEPEPHFRAVAQHCELLRVDRLLLAQDICQKHRLTAYGGHGYDHLLRDIPVMLAAGGRPEVAEQLLVANPAAWLAW